MQVSVPSLDNMSTSALQLPGKDKLVVNSSYPGYLKNMFTYVYMTIRYGEPDYSTAVSVPFGFLRSRERCRCSLIPAAVGSRAGRANGRSSRQFLGHQKMLDCWFPGMGTSAGNPK